MFYLLYDIYFIALIFCLLDFYLSFYFNKQWTISSFLILKSYFDFIWNIFDWTGFYFLNSNFLRRVFLVMASRSFENISIVVYFCFNSTKDSISYRMYSFSLSDLPNLYFFPSMAFSKNFSVWLAIVFSLYHVLIFE